MNIPLYDAAGKCKSKKGKPYCYNMLEKESKCRPFKDKAEMHSKNQEKLMKQGKKQESKAEGQKAEKATKLADDPELTVNTDFTLIYFANFFSNSALNLPVVNQASNAESVM